VVRGPRRRGGEIDRRFDDDLGGDDERRAGCRRLVGLRAIRSAGRGAVARRRREGGDEENQQTGGAELRRFRTPPGVHDPSSRMPHYPTRREKNFSLVRSRFHVGAGAGNP
jgi:hypothetical protein